MKFEIIHKPTFVNQLLTIPKEYMVQILAKIEILRHDPKPQGNLKKKLHGYLGNVYRLRSGDYRIIYTYDDGWVALLGVDSRKDIYKGNKLFAEGADFDVKSLPDVESLLTAESGYSAVNSQSNSQSILPNQQIQNTENFLPLLLTEDLLERLLVPKELRTNLINCRTFDDLIKVDIPENLRDRLFDCIYSPNFDLVLSQPSYRTDSTSDLLKFVEGSLVGFLLKLNPEQEKYVNWAIDASGPTLLKGGPGTGKSTVALYRVRALLQVLKKHGVVEPKILFTTYTNALITFSEQLLNNLLGEDMRYVKVKTADWIAYSLYYQYQNSPYTLAKNNELQNIMKRAISNAIDSLEGNLLKKQAQAQTLQRLTSQYLIDEICTVIEGRMIKTLELYQNTPRHGRMVSLNRTQRQAIWHLRWHFYQLLEEHKLQTWHQLRSRALAILETMQNPPIYDAVIVDETQDLDANSLRLLTKLCRHPNRIFITADANQSIYGSGFTWSDIHEDLKFVGRTGILKINHRTTREINEAAHSYLGTPGLQNATLDKELCNSQISPLNASREYIHTGPLPAVRAVKNINEENQLLITFFQQATREFRLGMNACAIFTPNEKVGRRIAEQLTALGSIANFMSGKNLDLNRRGVKVITLKSAKGLEFPVVAIAGFVDSNYPIAPKNTSIEGMTEILNRERRTLFVGMTRAMRGLLIIIPAYGRSSLLNSFDPRLWNIAT
ncbi:UvrD-helicase domain-containing protein [Cylindrospermopsis raciborskii]|uniref:UvrD-helicase domain-containing protein n=1 Tax=Cylindrospermopsis raciborskii TaxID=77022 RepID=UPI0022CBB0C7|nr:UvrD-helicase domain-containing protein [Cylindrospermopsis raciborskii]MCZ2205789.1 AAA family ATPase [Cylindrospermopsis raciborskii PAMP2011]